MRRLYFSAILTFFAINLSAQTIQQLKDSAATFPVMPRETADLVPYVQGLPTFASGAPFNDLDFTIFDTDYMDGENSGADVFMPVDPSARGGQKRIDISHLPIGLYFIQIGNYTEKFVVMR